MAWIKISMLSGLYLTHILISAYIFMQIEHPAEENRCFHSREAIKGKLDKMATENFYDISLNKKFCAAIELFNRDEKAKNNYNQQVLGYFSHLYNGQCSKESFERLMDTLGDKSHRILGQFTKLYDRLLKTAKIDSESFDNEVVSIEVSVLRQILSRTADFAVEDFTTYKDACEFKWQYIDSLIVAGSMATTIGYGAQTPATPGGRIFSIIYLLTVLPLFASIMINIGRETDRMLTRFYKMARRREYALDRSVFTAAYFLAGLIIVVIFPALWFQVMEGWTATDSMFFVIQTITTVGATGVFPSAFPEGCEGVKQFDSSACLSELVRPIPSKEQNEDGIPFDCDMPVWPRVAVLLNMWYRLVVFVWMLLGVIWSTSMLYIWSTETVQTGGAGRRVRTISACTTATETSRVSSDGRLQVCSRKQSLMPSDHSTVSFFPRTPTSSEMDVNFTIGELPYPEIVANQS